MGCKDSKFLDENEDNLKAVKISPVVTLPGFLTPKIEKSSPKPNESRQPNNTRTKPQSKRPSSQNIITDRRINAKYKFKGLIGKGSFSKVVRVEDKMSHQPYAIKMLDSSKCGETFEAELSVLQRVNHPNVIRLIEVLESNNIIYMVMEFAMGGSLLDKLECCGHYTEAESQRAMKMVLNGISYLHKLGITHRDLKPDNLLYYHPGKDSKLLITDFGFASTRKPDGNPYMHTVCGTPQYVAPEIVHRRPYTSAVDMWAVGVITFIVLSGTFPFDADRDTLIFKYIISGKYSFTGPVWKSVTDEGKKFIRQLLQSDPDQRLTADSARKHSWLSSVRGCSPARSSTVSGNVNSGNSTPLRRTGSQRSSHSIGSSRSLRSEHHRVRIHHLEALRNDPEFTAML